MKKKIIIFVLIMLTASAILAGCTSNNSSDNSNDNSNDITEEYDNQEFLSWLGNANQIISNYNDNELDAINAYEWVTLKTYSESEEKYIDNTLKPKCLNFHLIGDYNTVRDEYYQFLLDRSWAAFYMKWAADEMIDGLYSTASEDFGKASNYVELSTAHLDTCTFLLESLG